MNLRSEWRLWRRLRVAHVWLGKYIVTAATLLMLGWAILLLSSDDAMRSTPVDVLIHVFSGRVPTAVLLIAAAGCAQGGLRYRAAHPIGFDSGTFLVLLPQGIVLMLSAIASVHAVILGRYADGVERPWGFILADQLPLVVFAVLYAVMMAEIALDREEVKE